MAVQKPVPASSSRSVNFTYTKKAVLRGGLFLFIFLLVGLSLDMVKDSISTIRRGDILVALSMAADLATGQPMAFALKSCVMATRFGHALKLGRDQISQIYFQALLRYLGCNADTASMALLLGDEIKFRREFALIDPGRASEMLRLILTHLRESQQDKGLLAMAVGTLRALARSKNTSLENLSGHCEVAQRLAERLGLGSEVQSNLGQLYERWDGRGLPNGLKGEAVFLPVRIVSLVQDAIAMEAAFGKAESLVKLQARSGTAYEPKLLARFIEYYDELSKALESANWEDVINLEPEAQQPLSSEQLEQGLLAMADFADLKSPTTLGHSRALSALAKQAAQHCKLPAQDITQIGYAALLHDLGQVAIPTRIWMKPSAFNALEWEQVRLHGYYSERILSQSKAFSALAHIVGQHHERLDGSGYHRNAPVASLNLSSKILAAAEAYKNKIEARPHRQALSPKAVAEALKLEMRQGKLDATATSAVLAAAGHVVRQQSNLPNGLTAREYDVLRAIAKGQTMKEIARELGLSPKTVDNHTQSIFSKISVKTRGAAILFAIEHGLCGPT